MIRRLVMALLCGCSCLGNAAETGAGPLVAKVASPLAQIRSGPGEKHYVTQELEAGADIEIYRRDADGWLAIRPPAGSFSWVRAKQLGSTGASDLRRVDGEDVVAWVGSTREKVGSLKWQIRLEFDEVVEVHEQQKMRVVSDLPAEEYWRVSPPAGEYRWIHERDVEPLGIVAKPTVELADFQIVVDAEENRPIRRDTFVARSRAEQATDRKDDVRVATRTPRSELARKAPLANAEFERRIKDLDLRLALGVSRSPSSWNLTELRNELEQLSEHAGTTLQRARTQVLENRLAEYSELKQRYTGLETTSGGEELSEGPDDNGSDTRIAIDPRFDGLGWLLPVHSSKRESPPYALLDGDGKILQFVSPAPGLNLHRYLRKQVGIFGQRNQASILEKPHLTAHRIVDVQRHRMR